MATNGHSPFGQIGQSHIGQNGHTILVKRATYSRTAIKRVNATLFWSKPSHIRITTKTATDFSLQWRTIRITTIRGASLWILMGIFTVHPTNRNRFTACPSVRPSISMGLWYWELMSRPDPAVLPVGTLHSLEWFWVSRRIFIYSHHNTYVFSLRCPSVRLERFPGICRGMHRGIGLKLYMLVYLHHV